MLGFPSKTKESASWCLLISQADKMPSWAAHFIFCSQGLPWFSNNASTFAMCDSPESHLQLGKLCIQVLVPGSTLTASGIRGKGAPSGHHTVQWTHPYLMPCLVPASP